MRIAKYIANGGYCSRREAEKLILNKKVKINNKLCIHPSEKVDQFDKVKVENKLVKLEKKIRLWKIYKPIKYICSNKDKKNRKLIFNLIPRNFPMHHHLKKKNRIPWQSIIRLLFNGKLLKWKYRV